MNLSAEMPLGTLRHPDEFDPLVLCRISTHDVVRAVGRTIADDDPFSWSYRLPHDGSDGQLNELCLVPRRGNENVGIVSVKQPQIRAPLPHYGCHRGKPVASRTCPLRRAALEPTMSSITFMYRCLITSQRIGAYSSLALAA